MKRILATFAAAAAAQAFAWGGEGHSVIAELASHRLTPQARAEIERLLGPGVSLASQANWADDVRPNRPETYNLHFVDIPVKSDAYDPAKHCAPSPKGDCILAALDRAREQMRCSTDDNVKRDALRFATHFIGDLHQPLHTVDEAKGGNDIKVEVAIQAGKCPRCQLRRLQENLHSLWDSVLISQSSWNWGAYTAKLETGWLQSEAAKDVDAGTVMDWMLESHRVAAEFWDWLPEDRVIGDAYYLKAIPLVDRQLARGGARLAKFLNESLAGKATRNCA